MRPEAIQGALRDAFMDVPALAAYAPIILADGFTDFREAVNAARGSLGACIVIDEVTLDEVEVAVSAGRVAMNVPVVVGFYEMPGVAHTPARMALLTTAIAAAAKSKIFEFVNSPSGHDPDGGTLTIGIFVTKATVSHS